MNLIDAIKSGRPFRRAGRDDWYKDAEEWASSYHLHSFNNHSLVAWDVKADDWEIQEPTVTITASQFWEAASPVLQRGNSIWGQACGLNELLRDMAINLGLEPK